jgi:hypothetical protein
VLRAGKYRSPHVCSVGPKGADIGAFTEITGGRRGPVLAYLESLASTLHATIIFRSRSLYGFGSIPGEIRVLAVLAVLAALTAHDEVRQRC